MFMPEKRSPRGYGRVSQRIVLRCSSATPSGGSYASLVAVLLRPLRAATVRMCGSTIPFDAPFGFSPSTSLRSCFDKPICTVEVGNHDEGGS